MTRNAIGLQSSANDCLGIKNDTQLAVTPLSITDGQLGLDFNVAKPLFTSCGSRPFQYGGKRIVIGGRANHSIDQPGHCIKPMRSLSAAAVSMVTLIWTLAYWFIG